MKHYHLSGLRFSHPKVLKIRFRIPAYLFLTLLFQVSSGHASSIQFNDRVDFEPTECWGQVDGEARTDCGWLNVPEDWNAADSGTIRLAVAIYHALQPDESLNLSSISLVVRPLAHWAKMANI